MKPQVLMMTLKWVMVSFQKHLSGQDLSHISDIGKKMLEGQEQAPVSWNIVSVPRRTLEIA